MHVVRNGAKRGCMTLPEGSATLLLTLLLECERQAEGCDVMGADERVALGDLAVADAEYVDDVRLVVRAARLP